jgi:transcriptional regulator with PAS, ATPase and Fis domain
MSRVNAADAWQSEHPLIVASPTMLLLRKTVEYIAEGDAKVLISGESGVGKDLIARLIHVRSKRRGRAFVAVNCGAFSETLLETELFGHVRGSFTGAYRDKLGKLQLADGGTIFLDEVGEMTLRMQTLLLRFLENGELQPVGSDSPVRSVDVRVVSATNRNMAEMVAAGTFREDLMYRLKVVHVHVPPLRERREDIRPLIQHTLSRIGRDIKLSEEALEVLEHYRWPGNVRELQNVIEQLAWRPGTDVVGVTDLPVELQSIKLARGAARERRRKVSDELYEGLVTRQIRFWEDVRRLLLDREIAKRDMRELITRALAATGGNYHAILNLFGIPAQDYKRFQNFLTTHDCSVDFRPFRTGDPEHERESFDPPSAAPHRPHSRHNPPHAFKDPDES